MNVTTNGNTQVTPERIFQLGLAYAPPLIIETAVRHNIFDALDGGSSTVQAVAARAGTSERGTRIILNALVGIGLINKSSDQYTLAPDAANFLVRGKPAFVGGFFLHARRNVIPKWLELGEVVKTGKPLMAVNEEAKGSEFFQDFVADLFPVNYFSARQLAQTLNIHETAEDLSVLDLAAGSGVWGIAMAQASPKVKVTAVDWERVIPVTKKTTEKFGLKERFSFVAGDLATADLGRGHNIATLGQILHSEGEILSRSLLKRTFEALAPGGTIAIAEFLVNKDRTGPTNGLIFAVTMLLMATNGDTFSFEEIRDWLEDAGFEDARLVDIPGPSPIILATKPRAR